MNFFRNLKKNWLRLTISKEDLSLEHRIFYTVCIYSFLGIAVCALFNVGLGLYTLALFQTGFLIIQAIVFYILSVLKKPGLSIGIFAIGSYTFLILNYFYNGGLTGPTLISFFIAFQFLVTITPQRAAWVWFVLHVIVVTGLTTLEYYIPSAILGAYPTRASHFIDITITFWVILGFIYLLNVFARSRYFRERDMVAEQKTIIEEKNARLEYIDKERNRLFSIIAHDLRSPLTSINGYLELLAHGGLNEQERKEAEKHLFALSSHTSEMLNNLLAWSKGQLAGQKQDAQVLPVGETLRNTIAVQTSVAEKKSIDLRVQIAGDITFYAEKDSIDLVIRNLLSNAIKFTHSGGVVELRAHQEENFIVVCVEDNGDGIPESRKALIFTSELKPTPGTHHEKGIGLGLVMCKEFVERQGGSIGFESKEGEGTVFTVRIPANSSGKKQSRVSKVSSRQIAE